MAATFSRQNPREFTINATSQAFMRSISFSSTATTKSRNSIKKLQVPASRTYKEVNGRTTYLRYSRTERIAGTLRLLSQSAAPSAHLGTQTQTDNDQAVVRNADYRSGLGFVYTSMEKTERYKYKNSCNNGRHTSERIEWLLSA